MVGIGIIIRKIKIITITRVDKAAKARKSNNIRLKINSEMLVSRIVKSVIKMNMMKDNNMLTGLTIHQVGVVEIEETIEVVEVAIVMIIKEKRLTLIVLILLRIHCIMKIWKMIIHKKLGMKKEKLQTITILRVIIVEKTIKIEMIKVKVDRAAEVTTAVDEAEAVITVAAVITRTNVEVHTTKGVKLPKSKRHINKHEIDKK
mmetsp:Transcript_35176/g.47475  ORF Transcript_35176/g.47475 Transcript_35176/m.47475 type:complete len:203 (-) Transcript_35176:36-644(-)